MRIVNWKDLSAKEQKEVLLRPATSDDGSKKMLVADIINNIIENGDVALKEYSVKFDKLESDHIKLTEEEIKAACDKEAEQESTTQKTTESKLESATEKATESKPESTTEKSTESKPESITEKSTESKPESTTEKATESKKEPTTEEKESESMDYVLNTNTKKFHYTSCRSVKTIKDKNRKDYYGTRDELISRGYSPCGNCHP